jgi:transcriptional regulator with XRE-family HTH domain
MAEKNLSEEDLALVHESVGFLWCSIGKNVRSLREARGLTQELLSEMTGHGRYGISVRTIARLEAGQRVSDETLKAVAGALNVSLETLSQIHEREPEIGEEEERKLWRELVIKRKLNAIPVTLRRADRAGHDLIGSLNATYGFVPHYDPPSSEAEEDAIAEFFGALDDWILGWSDLSHAERFAARRQFDDMLKQLGDFGYRLYLGRIRHVWNQGTDKGAAHADDRCRAEQANDQPVRRACASQSGKGILTPTAEADFGSDSHPGKRPLAPRPVRPPSTPPRKSSCGRGRPAAATGRGFRLTWRTMGRHRRALPQGPCLVVQLEPRLLEVLDHPLGELVLGVVHRMLGKELADRVAGAKPISLSPVVPVSPQIQHS